MQKKKKKKEKKRKEKRKKKRKKKKEKKRRKRTKKSRRRKENIKNKKVPGVADGVREEALREARDALSRAEVALWPTLAESPPCRNRRLPTVELHSLSCSLSLALSLSLFPPLPLPLSRGWEHRLLLGLH